MLGLGLEIGLGLTAGQGGGGAVYSAEATAYFTAMSSQPDATRKGLIDTLIAGLKTDGVWSKLDLFYLLASHDAQSAGLNAKTPAANVITVTATCPFTTDRGYTSNGTTGYLDTNFNPATAGGNWTQNSASLFSWVNASSATAGPNCTWGNNGLTLAVLPHLTGSILRGYANSGAASFGTTASGAGSRCVSRTGAALVDAQLNGATSGTTQTTASAAPTSANAWLLRYNTTYNARDRIACAALGGGLSGAEMTALHNRVSTYLTAIGAQ